MSFAACAPIFRSSNGPRDSWIPLPNGGYRFSDQDLEIFFLPTDRQHFLWRFTNKTLISLEIDQDRLALRKTNDTRHFSLWGQPKDGDEAPTPIHIEPGGFVSLDFPVQYNSPFYPFEVNAEGEVWLEFKANWRRSSVGYRIFFPASLARQGSGRGEP